MSFAQRQTFDYYCWSQSLRAFRSVLGRRHEFRASFRLFSFWDVRKACHQTTCNTLRLPIFTHLAHSLYLRYMLFLCCLHSPILVLKPDYRTLVQALRWLALIVVCVACTYHCMLHLTCLGTGSGLVTLPTCICLLSVIYEVCLSGTIALHFFTYKVCEE